MGISFWLLVALALAAAASLRAVAREVVVAADEAVRHCEKNTEK